MFSGVLIADRTLEHLKNIREYELSFAGELLPPNGALLEIGAGTGWQARQLDKLGYQVSAIDVDSSNYSEERIWPVVNYDGHTIPFKDNYFDIIFSSNVLEHIPHIKEFQREIHRVLKPDGVVLHIVPSSSWRIWTNFTHLIRYWGIDVAHGEHAQNSFTEIYYFSKTWWKKLFISTDWEILQYTTNKIFYTGNSVMDSRLSINKRKILHRIIGSSCSVYLLSHDKS